MRLQAEIPPELLFHGTATRFIEKIKREGLRPGERQHVHLSTDKKNAETVGQRYGKPIVLTINALKMHEQGYRFFLSENGVWLTDAVPVSFIEL